MGIYFCTLTLVSCITDILKQPVKNLSLKLAEYFPNRCLDNDGDGLSDYKVISKMDEDLRLEFIERRLTIIYYDDTTMDQQPVSCSIVTETMLISFFFIAS